MRPQEALLGASLAVLAVPFGQTIAGRQAAALDPVPANGAICTSGTNLDAIAADERYFRTSPSDPVYRSSYFPHNIHFLMVSSQMGGDGKTALDAAARLDKSLGHDLVKEYAVLEQLEEIERSADFKPFAVWNVPAQEIVHTARAVASGRLLDASGDLPGAIKAYREAVAVQDALPYMEPPYAIAGLVRQPCVPRHHLP